MVAAGTAGYQYFYHLAIGFARSRLHYNTCYHAIPTALPMVTFFAETVGAGKYASIRFLQSPRGLLFCPPKETTEYLTTFFKNFLASVSKFYRGINGFFTRNKELSSLPQNWLQT